MKVDAEAEIMPEGLQFKFGIGLISTPFVVLFPVVIVMVRGLLPSRACLRFEVARESHCI